MTYQELLDMGYEQFGMKMSSIPESEPIFTTIKARVINTGKIKDKNERKYWEQQKRLHKIPDEYLPNKELNKEIKNKIKLGEFTNGKRIK